MFTYNYTFKNNSIRKIHLDQDPINTLSQNTQHGKKQIQTH